MGCSTGYAGHNFSTARYAGRYSWKQRFGRAPKFNLRLNLLNSTWQQSKVAKSSVLWWVASATLVYVSSFRARKVLKLVCWRWKIMFFPLGICFSCRLLGCHRPSCLRPAVQTHRSLKPPDGKHGARVSMAILILFSTSSVHFVRWFLRVWSQVHMDSICSANFSQSKNSLPSWSDAK